MVLSGTSASSTTKTGCHDIAESGINQKKIKSNQIYRLFTSHCLEAETSKQMIENRKQVWRSNLNYIASR